jgi:hypothetical protein
MRSGCLASPGDLEQARCCSPCRALSFPQPRSVEILVAFAVFYLVVTVVWRIAAGTLRAIGDILRMLSWPLLWLAHRQATASAHVLCRSCGSWRFLRGRIAVAFGHYPEFSPAAPINAWAAFFGRCLSSRLVACIDRCKSFGTSCPIAALTASPFHFSSWTKAACCAMRSSSFSTRRCGSRRARRRVDEASSTDKLIEMGEYIGIGARVFVALRKSSARGGLGLPGVYHAVTPHCRVALCSTEPGIRSEWAEPPASRLGCRADIVRSALGLAWAAGLALG